MASRTAGFRSLMKKSIANFHGIFSFSPWKATLVLARAL